MADDPGKSTADGPRPDTAETTHAPGDGASSGGMGPAPQGIPVPVPWYRRPLFWGIVLSLLILALGLVAFVLDSVVGVLFVKVLNIFTPKNKINPMVGAAGISAFPMSSRVIEKLGQEADSQNPLRMHAVAANVSGQIASVVAGGVVLQYFANNPIL